MQKNKQLQRLAGWAVFHPSQKRDRWDPGETQIPFGNDNKSDDNKSDDNKSDDNKSNDNEVRFEG